MASLSQCWRAAGTHTAISRCLICSSEPFFFLHVTVHVLKEAAASPSLKDLALSYIQGSLV